MNACKARLAAMCVLLASTAFSSTATAQSAGGAVDAPANSPAAPPSENPPKKVAEGEVIPPADSPEAQSFVEAINTFIGPPAEQLFVTPGGVDIRTGKYAYKETDLMIGGEDGLTLVRSMGIHGGSYGNFAHNWDITLVTKKYDVPTGNYTDNVGQSFRVLIQFPDGTIETFESEYPSTGFQQKSLTPTASLTFVGDRNSSSVVYTFEGADGTIMRFTPGGFASVSEIIRPDGTHILLDYAGSPVGSLRPRSITSSRGYALLLEHDANNLVTKACSLNLAYTLKPSDNMCPASAQATTYYSYTSLGRLRLATSTDASGATSAYGYSAVSGGFNMAFTKPGASAPWLTNTMYETSNAQGQYFEVTTSQSFASGQSYIYDYEDADTLTSGAISMPVGTAYTNAAGQRTAVKFEFPQLPRSMTPQYVPPEQTEETCCGRTSFQVTPGPVEVSDPLGRITTMNYCDPYMQQALPSTDQHRCVVKQLQSYTDPEGKTTKLFYGGRHVVRVERQGKPGSGSPDIILQATYQCAVRKTCVSPSSLTDANGNVSTATYSADHGGVLTETGPAVNGVQPQKRYSYVQRYAWLKGGAGYASAATPVWLLASESTCRSSAWTGTSCAVAGDEVITTYDYGPNAGPNNLWLRGTAVSVNGQTRRTCYGYDALGRRISQTTANSNVASCS